MRGPSELLALGLLLVLGACGEEGAASSRSARLDPERRGPSDPDFAGRRNVVLITHDTTRADHLSCYGYEWETTPNLDALAAEGVRFELCISVASVTPVSHASILTGLYPHQHGLRVLYAESGYTLPESIPTLASVLAAAGWRTGAFVSAFPVSEIFGLNRAFTAFDNGLDGDPRRVFEDDGEHQRWDLARYQRRSDETTDAALAWLAEVEEPFFLWIHYWDPHDQKIVPPPEVIVRFKSNSKEGLYDAEIAFVDQQFGRLLDALKDDGRYDRTLVAVTSDHGQGLGEHNWYAHRLLYQEHIRLPLILRDPAQPRGVVVDDLVRSIDVYPTVLELLGVEPPAPVEGRSLLPLWSGETEAPRQAYADQLNLWDSNAAMLKRRPEADLLHVWMDRRWKLIFRPLRPDESELYDLQQDPRELHDVAADHPDVVHRLRTELEGLGAIRSEGFGTVDEGDVRTEALNALGYLGGDEEDE